MLTTNLKDAKGTEIKYCDILINPFARDLFFVYRKDGIPYVTLVPSSGAICHPANSNMSLYEVKLEEVAEFFVVVGGVTTDPSSIKEEDLKI